MALFLLQLVQQAPAGGGGIRMQVLVQILRLDPGMVLDLPGLEMQISPHLSQEEHHLLAQMPISPYRAWYTTIGSWVSEWRATDRTRYSLPLKWR